MKKEQVIRKLTSRKLWLAVALFVSGLITALGGEASVGETVTGCIMQAGAVVSYIFAEGWTDAKCDSTTSNPDVIADHFGE